MAVYLNGEEVGVIVNSGSTPEPPTTNGKYHCLVIDYNGNTLKERWLNTGDIFNLPSEPSHTGLVFQEWSSPVTITNNSITVGNSDITIGAVYKTASGLTEFDIELTKVTGLEVTCNMVGNKNWGDGTINSETTHTYTEYGNYTITCDGTNLRSVEPSNILTELRIGENVTSLGSGIMNNNTQLRTVIIPNTVISVLPGNTFYNCKRLNSIVIPSSINSIPGGMFQNCLNLKSCAIPKSITSIGMSGFGYSYINSITLPENLTEIDVNIIGINPDNTRGPAYIKRLTIPSGITNINSFAFSNQFSIIEYDFTTLSAIPTLSATNAFSGISELCKIYVPDALYDDWIVATNWATYADYIYKASEMED